MRNIKEKFGVDIPFPIIADLKMDVARAYGMIHSGANERMESGEYECIDFYYCTKEL